MKRPENRLGGWHGASRIARRRVSRSLPGVTLLEILLVLSILVAVAAMAVPMLNGPLENHRLRNSADTIRSEWSKARLQAMQSGQTYVFRYQPEGTEYVTQPWSSDEDCVEASVLTLDGSAAVASTSLAGTASSATGIGQVRQLPEKISFMVSEAVPDVRGELLVAEDTLNQASYQEWSSPIFFYPDGTTSTARLSLGNQRQRYVMVTIRGLTGIVQVSELLSSEEMPLLSPGAAP